MLPATVREIVAAEVRAEMARQMVTQRDLAAALGVSQTAVWRYLRGDRPFRVEELVKVAEFLQCPVAQFLPVIERVA